MFGQQLTLHQLISKRDWDGVEERCRTHPREARKLAICGYLDDGFRKSKALPLHYACAVGAPSHVVMALLTAHDRATEVKETGYKRLPIHTALLNVAHPDVILALVHEYPLAVNEIDDLGRLPLHYAIANGASLQVISELIKVDPKTTHATDYRGWTSLHVACGVGAPPVVIRWLLKANPDAVNALSNADETPLWFAQNFKTPNPKVVELLEEATQRFKKVNGLSLEVMKNTNLSEKHNMNYHRFHVGEIV